MGSPPGAAPPPTARFVSPERVGPAISTLTEPAIEYRGGLSAESRRDPECRQRFRESRIRYHHKHRPAAERALQRAGLVVRGASRQHRS